MVDIVLSVDEGDIDVELFTLLFVGFIVVKVFVDLLADIKFISCFIY